MDQHIATLLEAYETGDHQVARGALRDFERIFLAHLEVEEQLLPEFAISDAAEALWVSADHNAIRRTFNELEIGADLHLTRLSAIRELAGMLETHARREDETFYAWAEQHYSDDRGTAMTAESPASHA